MQSYQRYIKNIFTKIDAEKKILPVTDRDTFKKWERRINLSVNEPEVLPSPSLYGWPRESEDKHDHDLIQNFLKGCSASYPQRSAFEVYMPHTIFWERVAWKR